MRFTIRRLMTVVAVAALVLTPFAWTPPGSRWALLRAALIVIPMMMMIGSGFLVEFLDGKATRLRPRTFVKKPLPFPLRLFDWPPPPHRRSSL